jgi:hypothetical protein
MELPLCVQFHSDPHSVLIIQALACARVARDGETTTLKGSRRGQGVKCNSAYTDLPGLLYLLQRKKITLLDPMTWDDTNDSHFLKIYKQAKNLTCLSALCFSDADETYHHWRVFAGGSSGVRLTFLRQPLLNLVSKVPGISHRKVKYELIEDIRHSDPLVQDLPFLKRYPYQHEDEYRLIFESEEKPQQAIDIDLPLTLIRSVTLSPWINKRVADAVKEALKCIPTCQKLKVGRSTLIGNDEWMAFGDRAIKQRFPEQ